MGGKTSTEVKEKYNKNAYERYSIRVRKDDFLNERIKEFMSKKGTSFNHLILKLLNQHFMREGE